MKRVTYMICLLSILLTACCAVEPESEDIFTHGIYEINISCKQISGDTITEAWDIAYTCNGEPIESGHQIIFSLEVFSFQSIGVEIVEKDVPENVFSDTLTVALLDGGTGKTEIAVTPKHGEHAGNSAIFEIVCTVTQVGKTTGFEEINPDSSVFYG